jgi:type I restriction enzyme S subunit
MSKVPQKALVPELRFPEFQGEPEWKVKLLHQVCEVNPSVKKLPNRFVYIDLESVEAGVLVQKNVIRLEGAPSRAQRLLEDGDSIFQMVRPYQKNNLLFVAEDELDYVASTGYAQLRAHQSNTYLYQYIHNERFVLRVLDKCTGSNYPAINSSELSEIYLEIPEPEEQQKIADCLSSIDELLTAHTQKHDALKEYKKGLMQQLFPAEGETVPKLRIPEFRDAGEWEENHLGGLSTIVRGGSPRPIDEYITNDINGLNWLKIGDVDKESKYITQTSERVKVTALSKTREVNPGDLIMSNSMSFGRPYILKIQSCIHDGWIAVTEITNGIALDYLYYLILSSSSQLYFLNAAAGGGIKNLNADIIKLLSVAFPRTEMEQQKIADCLSSIDELIAAQAQKIETLKDHKKGLMQQLFPSTDEEGA